MALLNSSKVVDFCKIGMAQPGQGFVFDLGPFFGVFETIGTQNLECDLAFHARQIFTQKHRSHRTGSELTEDTIAPVDAFSGLHRSHRTSPGTGLYCAFEVRLPFPDKDTTRYEIRPLRSADPSSGGVIGDFRHFGKKAHPPMRSYQRT